MKIIVLYAAPSFFLAISWVFYRLVVPRLPAEVVAGWRIFTAGFLLAVAGLSLAVYFDRVDDGATVAMFGIIVSACGLLKLFKDWPSNY